MIHMARPVASPSFLLTTTPGLEAITMAEFREKTAGLFTDPPEAEPEPFEYKGVIQVTPPVLEKKAGDKLLAEVRKMRTIHHISELLHLFRIPEEDPLNTIQKEVEELAIPEMEHTRSFRVSCKRKGSHSFGSMDVEKLVGEVMVQRYGRKVDLEHFTTNLRVDIYRDRAYVAIQRTRKSLGKRFQRPYLPRVTLKPTIAYAMLHLAGLQGKKSEQLLDPFCGSGTILMEAASVFPELKVMGGDRSPVAVNGTKRNLEVYGLEERVQVQVRNARRLEKEFSSSSVDAVVTDPPYGLKTSQYIDFGALYGAIIRQLDHVLKPQGKAVLMVWKKKFFERINREEGLFNIEQSYCIETGGVYLHVIVLTRKALMGEE